MNSYAWTDGSELYHHGIKGQKWGVRRFQNADGTLTSEGKQRYGKIKDAAKKVSAVGAVGSLAGGLAGSAIGFSRTLNKPVRKFDVMRVIDRAITPGGPRVLAKEAGYDYLSSLDTIHKFKDIIKLAHTFQMRGNGIIDKAVIEGTGLSSFDLYRANDYIQAGQELAAFIGKTAVSGAIKGALVGALPTAAIAAGAASIAIYAGTKILANRKRESSKEKEGKRKE